MDTRELRRLQMLNDLISQTLEVIQQRAGLAHGPFGVDMGVPYGLSPQAIWPQLYGQQLSMYGFGPGGIPAGIPAAYGYGYGAPIGFVPMGAPLMNGVGGAFGTTWPTTHVGGGWGTQWGSTGGQWPTMSSAPYTNGTPNGRSHFGVGQTQGGFGNTAQI